MYDLIGRPYRLGADGTDADGALDCIHLVYAVLERLSIATPAFNPAWYDGSPRLVLTALAKWGHRIKEPAYNGDVVLVSQQNYAFGVAWQDGILLTAAMVNRVEWRPFRAIPVCRCYRSNCFPMSTT
jgi:hypothetical protein